MRRAARRPIPRAPRSRACRCGGHSVRARARTARAPAVESALPRAAPAGRTPRTRAAAPAAPRCGRAPSPRTRHNRRSRRRAGQRAAALGSSAASDRVKCCSGASIGPPRLQPPATGGRNATVSPSASGVRQSPNSSLTATRRNCGASVSPRCEHNCSYSSRGVRAGSGAPRCLGRPARAAARSSARAGVAWAAPSRPSALTGRAVLVAGIDVVECQRLEQIEQLDVVLRQQRARTQPPCAIPPRWPRGSRARRSRTAARADRRTGCGRRSRCDRGRAARSGAAACLASETADRTPVPARHVRGGRAAPPGCRRSDPDPAEIRDVLVGARCGSCTLIGADRDERARDRGERAATARARAAVRRHRRSIALSRCMRRLRPPASTRPYSSGSLTRRPSRARARAVIALAAALGQQAHAADADVVRQRLAHVVDRERGDAWRRSAPPFRRRSCGAPSTRQRT